MISEERALEIANEYLTRDGGTPLRLMNIHFWESSPLKSVVQQHSGKKHSSELIEVPVWKEPVWAITYFFPKEGVAGGIDLFVNARTGEVLEHLSF